MNCAQYGPIRLWSDRYIGGGGGGASLGNNPPLRVGVGDCRPSGGGGGLDNGVRGRGSGLVHFTWVQGPGSEVSSMAGTNEYGFWVIFFLQLS